MILKQYGTSYQSVETNFNSRALTEVAFRRDRAFSLPVEEFEATFERVDERAFSPETEGDVQDQAEEALLKALDAEIAEALAGLGEGEVLVVESKEGEDHPKTRDRKQNVIVDGENRLYFYWRIDPPLRLGVYRKKG
jgi:hypothetical protein